MTEIRHLSLDLGPPCPEAAPRAATRRRPDVLDPEDLCPWRASHDDPPGALVIESTRASPNRRRRVSCKNM